MKSLVLVLGAGASKEVGLPIGAELKSQIARLLDIRFHHGSQQVSGDVQITQSLRRIASQDGNGRGDINPYLHMCRRIRDAMPQAISIDNFIDSHAGEDKIALCGKLAIARAILSAESTSTLTVDRSNINNKLDFAKNTNTWFNGFFQLLTENCRLDDLPARLKSIGVVTFNYDRCLEQFLFHALQNYYAISPTEAAAALVNLEIHHPYGMVGRLPWMDQQETVEFGTEPNATELISIAGQLRTFTEGTNPTVSNIDVIRHLITEARRLTFFGFSFHRLNMSLLFGQPSPETSQVTTSIYATAFGISSSDCRHIANELSTKTGLPNGPMQVRNDLTCAGLVQEYWRSLSLN